MTWDKAALYSRVSVAAIHKVSVTSSEVNTMGLTSLMILHPVPIPKEVIKGIVPMAVILLLCTACCLILLCPTCFDHLPICLAGVLDILECPQNLTPEKVPSDMSTWDCSTNV